MISIVILTCLFLIFSKVNITTGFNCIKPNLEITIGADSKHLTIKWEKEDIIDGDWIGLYDGQPSMQDSHKYRVDRFDVNDKNGWHKTKVKYVHRVDMQNFQESVNLGYFAVYWRKNRNFPHWDEAVTTTKLNTYPNWMKMYWNVIKDNRLDEVFLPGTHDSGCNEALSVQVKPEIEKKSGFKGFLKGVANAAQQSALLLPFVSKITYTQDQTILEQLILGIRYLDIRISKSGDTFWIVHGDMKMVKLEDGIRDVVNFIENTEKEIVIFDIHQTSGLDKPEDHDELIRFLKEKFTSGNRRWYVPLNGDRDNNKNWKRTLEDVLNSGGRIIVPYIDNDVQKNNNQGFLWPKVNQLWGDKQNILDLKTYFFEEAFVKFWRSWTSNAAMAELTPNISGNPTKLKKEVDSGLAVQAERNANEINSWFMDPKLGLKTNILAVDYFRNMGTVRTAIIWNVRRARWNANKHCDPQDSVKDWYYQHNIIY